MGNPNQDAEDQISITGPTLLGVDVPIGLIEDVSEGKVSANALTTYVMIRWQAEQRTGADTTKIADLRRITHDQIGKHLEQLEKAGWIDSSTGSIAINDSRFEDHNRVLPYADILARFRAE